MAKNWINQFAEGLFGVEGRFDLYVTLFLKYQKQFVFRIKNTQEWLYEQGKKKTAISTFGGLLEEGGIVPLFLEKICRQELGIKIQVIDSSQTFIDYQHRLKEFPVKPLAGQMRPYVITILSKSRGSDRTNTLIFNYLGYTEEKPNPINLSALFLAKEPVLVQMFKKERTIKDLKSVGAHLIERIKIPENLYLYPTGSVNSLLRFVNYEAF